MADSQKPKFRHGEPGQVVLHVPPTEFAVGMAGFRQAESYADSNNTAMKDVIVSAARRYTNAPLIAPDFTESELAIFAVLREAGKRLTKNGILSALSSKGINASEGMTGQTLATLKRFGFLTNQTDSYGKGYGLPEWSKS